MNHTIKSICAVLDGAHENNLNAYCHKLGHAYSSRFRDVRMKDDGSLEVLIVGYAGSVWFQVRNSDEFYAN